ncbi:MAG: hypothetical protein M4579_001126 [Chaenotheca gracillima]|nr:MAG: hypothetical protein M4579_001126 [Chaenotheca gracillima]
MIKAIFFTKFLSTEGPKVLHQVPDGSIIPSPTSNQLPLFDFKLISPFLIPRQEFCDRLVSITANRHRILGHPVCIANRKYVRNELLFNFAIVLEENKDMSSYVTVVRKLAKLFRTLEEQGEFLSRELGGPRGGGHGARGNENHPRGNEGKVYALCEIILEDLNNYCECMIPIDESNTINIKLFPLYPPPPPVKSWHVPLSTVRLESLMDENWDLTMQKIVPFIDGINSVRRISEHADADYNLVKKCIEHLLYYRTLLLLPPHHFSAVFAPSSDLPLFLSSPSMQTECASYVSTSTDGTPILPSRLIALYASLRHGQSLKQWCIEQGRDGRLDGIDLRRFVTFGLIKGIIYRVHKWVVRGGSSTAANPDREDPYLNAKGERDATAAETIERHGISRRDSRNLGHRTSSPSPFAPAITATRNALGDVASEVVVPLRPGFNKNGASASKPVTAPGRMSGREERSKTYLDGTHPLDEICTDLQVSEREALVMLRVGLPATGLDVNGSRVRNGGNGGVDRREERGGDLLIIQR